jgi:hypothetical protein
VVSFVSRKIKLERTERSGGFEPGRCWMAGQENGETGSRASGADGAAQAHVTVMLLNGAHAEPQPQTRALGALGGEESVENSIADFGRDSATIVGDEDADTGALRVAPFVGS